MTPDILLQPLPNTLDLSGLPEGVVRQVTAIVEAAPHDPATASVAGDTPPNTPPLPYDQWLAELDAWRRDAEARADRYPPGHVIDGSRETIYGERGGEQR